MMIKKFFFDPQELRELYCSKNLSLDSISLIFGCTRSTVAVAVRAAGIQIRQRNPKGCKMPLQHHIDAVELRRLYEGELWSCAKIGKHFGCSDTPIFKRLRSIGVKVRGSGMQSGGRSKKRVPTNDAAIIEAYLPPTASISDVANALGYTPIIVARVLREHGIQSKPLSQVNAGRVSGPAHPGWNSDLTQEERASQRDTTKAAIWRGKVYERDNFTCRCCGDARGGNLNAHHIENYKSNKAVRWKVENGATLCGTCHRRFHRQFGYGGNDARQLQVFTAQARR